MGLMYEGWSVPKVPFPCGRPNLLLTVHFSWSYSYLNVTFKFEHHVTFKFERHIKFEGHMHIWISHLNVNLTFEGHSHIWTSISHLRVTLTFEHQSHIWGSLSHFNVNLTFDRHSQIWTSILHLNVKLMCIRLHTRMRTALHVLAGCLWPQLCPPRSLTLALALALAPVVEYPELESFLLRLYSSWSALTLGVYPRSRQRYLPRG